MFSTRQHTAIVASGMLAAEGFVTPGERVNRIRQLSGSGSARQIEGVSPATAARVRIHADRTGQSMSEWIADLLRREVLRAGAADELSTEPGQVHACGSCRARGRSADGT
jgi:hypothetical protein